jgi:hypothetical protein
MYYFDHHTEIQKTFSTSRATSLFRIQRAGKFRYQLGRTSFRQDRDVTDHTTQIGALEAPDLHKGAQLKCALNVLTRFMSCDDLMK